MVKRAKYIQPESKELSVADLQKAITKVKRRIDDLKNFDVTTITEQCDARTQALKDKINSTLADIFGHDTVEYRKYDIWSLEDLQLVMGRTYPLDEVKSATQKGIEDAVIKLESLKETLQEKFEGHSDVGFAVVLMTPDDVGALAKEKDKLNPRARQNVILELGFFLGKLGRKHVCALYKEGVEIPSDYKGVLFIPMDKNDGWKLSLAREIKATGIEIDLNKAM